MKHEIDRVRLESGEWVMLADLPCANCGKPGCTHIALWDDGSHAFCSWEHLADSMRINDQPLTEDLMKQAGLHVIGPRPEA